jgi:hypothetical protein
MLEGTLALQRVARPREAPAKVYPAKTPKTGLKYAIIWERWEYGGYPPDSGGFGGFGGLAWRYDRKGLKHISIFFSFATSLKQTLDLELEWPKGSFSEPA